MGFTEVSGPLFAVLRHGRRVGGSSRRLLHGRLLPVFCAAYGGVIHRTIVLDQTEQILDSPPDSRSLRESTAPGAVPECSLTWCLMRGPPSACFVGGRSVLAGTSVCYHGTERLWLVPPPVPLIPHTGIQEKQPY